ncbi:MAG TPA: hypothetical protein VFA74_00330 [Terriglobales bacterium]|nr:hypothetical protein [Terriglobales bacterium]
MALEAGLDGPAIRRLAALDHPTWSELDLVLPRAMREMQLAVITIGEAARRFAIQRAKDRCRILREKRKRNPAMGDGGPKEFRQWLLKLSGRAALSAPRSLRADFNAALKGPLFHDL